MKEAVIVSAARTPIGSFQGQFGRVGAVELGASVIGAVCRRANLGLERVDHVWMGHVLQAGLGMNPARQASVAAGLPFTAPAASVSLVCGSGLLAVIEAARAVRSGDVCWAVAGGMENMTQAPHVLPGLRAGVKYGNAELLDTALHDGLTCAISRQAMGITAERLAERFGISREAQDAYAALSQQRAEAAVRSGRFADEIVPVEVRERAGVRMAERDEHPRFGTTPEALAKLKPAFEAGGTVTAGNASGINDGAAAVLVASTEEAQDQGLEPLGLIKGYATVGVEPQWMGLGPVPALRKALAQAGLKLEQLDLIEINEAFASQTIACLQELGIGSERVNVNGGAIALGHPIGASGARILVTLLHELKRRQGRFGAAALCVGGGHGVALIVERP
ncbi:acetyl-CoA C-acetyltransferase [Paenibacillus azoreducens]|uniref:acetyl-CoA C-acetyltransferase n=1 Tax=Paenibacillus azoreducens TaxID=116718 RepID=UPI0039F5A9A7